MVSSVLRKSIMTLLRQNGPMRLMDIHRTLSAKDKTIRYVEVEVCVRGNIGTEYGQFTRIKRGLYKATRKMTRQKLVGLPVFDKKCNRKAVRHSFTEFNVLEHRKFLRIVAKALASEFCQDADEIYSMAIELAYSLADQYEPSKGTPTTFINCQVAPRLRNKITREFLPNIFRMEDVEQPDGTIKREGRRVFISHESLYAPMGGDAQGCLLDIVHKDTLEGDMQRGLDQPDEAVAENDIVERVRNALQSASLSDKEAIVVEKAFGLDGAPDSTLEEIGRLDGVNMTKEGVRQLLLKVKSRLKKDPRFIKMRDTLAL